MFTGCGGKVAIRAKGQPRTGRRNRVNVMKLPVPIIAQDKDSWCLPASVEMLLQYYHNIYGDGIKVMRQSKIAEICETNEDGTLKEAVVMLNPEIQRNIPLIEFKSKCGISINQLEKMIENKHPIITFIEGAPGTQDAGHAVVVTGIDKRQYILWYIDPLVEREIEESIGRFIDMWKEGYCGWVIEFNLQGRLVETEGEESD